MRRTAQLIVVLVASIACFAQPTAHSQKVRRIYEQKYSSKLVPLLTEVLRFPTVEGNTDARDRQQKWIETAGTSLGLTVRNAGLITEVELPGPANSPVLGLV